MNIPITTIEKMKQTINTENPHTIYIYTKINSNNSNIDIVGYIKYSIKHLYFYTKKGIVYEKDTKCVLDFYILETLQRNGIGINLFKYSINNCITSNINNNSKNNNKNTNNIDNSSTNPTALIATPIEPIEPTEPIEPIEPTELAYDRPSMKLIGFLKKHYNLINGDLQPNKYMIYNGFE